MVIPSPVGSRTDFGALLVGYYEQGALRYAGKVGTGYTKSTLNDLGLRLRKLGGGRAYVCRRATDPSRHALDEARSSSLRSALPSGRVTLGCASRASRAPRRQEPG